MFKQYKFPFGVVDEMHQMNPYILLAALVHLEEAIMFFDPAQQIDMSNLVLQDESDGHRLVDKSQRIHSRFSWSRSIGAHSKAPEHVQDWLPVNAIASLPVSWRFGDDCPALLRYASIAYSCNKNFHTLEEVNAGIWSIEAFKHQLHPEQHAAIPQTKIRVFLYKNESYYGYAGHGQIRSLAHRVVREERNKAVKRSRNEANDDTGSNSKNVRRQKSVVDERVAVSEEILIQGIHSGLLYLSARKHRHVRDDGSAVLSLFYCNPSRRVFQTIAHAVLQDKEIMASYGLKLVKDPSERWRVCTPEAASGKDVGLCQFFIIPRIMRVADLAGNANDDGRFNVGLTRMRDFLEIHASEECLQSAAPGRPWHKFANSLMTNAKSPFRGNVEVVDCAQNYVPKLSENWYTNHETHEVDAGVRLRHFLLPLPTKNAAFLAASEQKDRIVEIKHRISFVDELYTTLDKDDSASELESSNSTLSIVHVHNAHDTDKWHSIDNTQLNDITTPLLRHWCTRLIKANGLRFIDRKANVNERALRLVVEVRGPFPPNPYQLLWIKSIILMKIQTTKSFRGKSSKIYKEG